MEQSNTTTLQHYNNHMGSYYVTLLAIGSVCPNDVNHVLYIVHFFATIQIWCIYIYIYHVSYPNEHLQPVGLSVVSCVA